MNLVDDVRTRFKDSSTKLILILVPSKRDDGVKSTLECRSNELCRDLTEDTSWKKEGI